MDRRSRGEPGMTDDPIVAGFIRAARVAGAVVASPEVAAAWARDRALEQMTVGSVAGHLFLVVRRVDEHLDEPEPTRPPVRALDRYAWLRVEEAEDLDVLRALTRPERTRPPVPSVF